MSPSDTQVDPPAPPPRLPQQLTAPELLTAELPARRTILDPLLSTKSLALLYGPHGIGKTFLALGIAWAAASGGRFLDWQAARPNRVLYIDGEMAAVDMRERLRLFGATPETMPATLSFLLGDLNRKGGGLPDLGCLEGQVALCRQWDTWPDLLVLDNLASLVGTKGGDAECWSAVQLFLMHMRRCEARRCWSSITPTRPAAARHLAARGPARPRARAAPAGRQRASRRRALRDPF